MKGNEWMKGKSTLKQNLTTCDDIHSILDKLIANIYISTSRDKMEITASCLNRWCHHVISDWLCRHTRFLFELFHPTVQQFYEFIRKFFWLTHSNVVCVRKQWTILFWGGLSVGRVASVYLFILRCTSCECLLGFFLVSVLHQITWRCVFPLDALHVFSVFTVWIIF